MNDLFKRTKRDITLRRIHIAFHASGNSRVDGAAAMQDSDMETDTATLVRKWICADSSDSSDDEMPLFPNFEMQRKLQN